MSIISSLLTPVSDYRNEQEALIAIWPRINKKLPLAAQYNDPLSAGQIQKHINSLTKDQLGSVTELDLSELGLQTIPDEIGQFFNLKKLDLRNNEISTITNSILCWPVLEKLYLSNNKIQDISSIPQWVNLRELYVNNNLIKDIPTSIIKLVYLKELDISNNQILDPTISIGQMLDTVVVLRELLAKSQRGSLFFRPDNNNDAARLASDSILKVYPDDPLDPFYNKVSAGTTYNVLSE
jgi:hypothetical protein